MKKLLLALLTCLIHKLSLAALPSPIGLWKIIGDQSGEPEALIQISEKNGTLEGKIVSIFPRPGVDPEARCESCSGERKNKPIKGLTILNGLRARGDEFTDGEILDPDSGDIYRCTLKISSDNRKLFVRGYLGISIFGRTQTWLREQ